MTEALPVKLEGASAHMLTRSVVSTVFKKIVSASGSVAFGAGETVWSSTTRDPVDASACARCAMPACPLGYVALKWSSVPHMDQIMVVP